MVAGHAQLYADDVVLDVGCGGGTDAILAARRVGAAGRVIGLDLLPEMCHRARRHAAQAGLGNVEFIDGEMEAIPLPDESVDVVVSNGVINLSPRKMRALFECARVLRRGGRLCLTDVTIDEHRLPPEVLTHPAAWSGCAAGAMAERVLLRSLTRVGFTNVVVRERHPFGVADCACFPLFTPDLLDIMRRTIPPDRQADIATCVTVTARNTVDANVIAARPARNKSEPPSVLTNMDPHAPIFDAGDRHCGDRIAANLRAWWDAMPPGTLTVVRASEPSTKTDLPSLARLLGHTIEHSAEPDGVLHIAVRTKGVAP